MPMHYTWVNHEFWSDLAWWHLFLEDWNGISFFQVADYLQVPSAIIQTDDGVAPNTHYGERVSPHSVLLRHIGKMHDPQYHSISV